MNKANIHDEFELRIINRSEFWDLPSDCQYCGYRNRPTSSQSHCSGCCSKQYKK